VNKEYYTEEFKKAQAEFEKAQEKADLWSELIGDILPENLDELAKTSGAIIRKRGIKVPLDLLKVLLVFAVAILSIRMLALCAKALKISSISDTAWRKKIANSALWLVLILDYILPKPPPEGDEMSKGRPVHLLDGSCVVQEGTKDKGNGKVFYIHMSYGLTLGAMDEIKVTDNHTAEGIQHYTIQKGHIYIADSNYGKAKIFDYIVSKQADAILRISPNHVALYTKSGKKIDLAKLFGKTKKSVLDFDCYMKNGKKTIKVRIVASRLPEDKQADAIKRKKRKSQKNQTKIKSETLIYATWVVLATSLDRAEYTLEQVLEIYRCRWQVELLFKRIKQHFKVTKIKPCSKKYAQSLILLWLIIWAITERQTVAAELFLKQQEFDLNRVSIWTMSSFFFHQVKTIIDCAWATFFKSMDDILVIMKYLQNHKSSRRNQYYEYRFLS